MSASSYVGTILPQFGTLEGAKLFIDGVDVSPTTMQPVPPPKRGANGKGRPFYIGRYGWIATYDQSSLDEYQRLTTIFYPKLGTFAGTLVDVVLPHFDQAGRFVEATAYMEWPTMAPAGTSINGVQFTLSSFRLKGEA